MLRLAFLVLTAVLPIAALATTPPAKKPRSASAGDAVPRPPIREIKGIALGSSEANLKELFPAAVCTSMRKFVQRLCSVADQTIAGARTRLHISIFEDAVYYVAATEIPETEFDRLAVALQEKFGDPTFSENGSVSNAMGVEFEVKTLRWTDGDAELEAVSRYKKIDEAQVTLISKARIERVVAENEQLAREKADDL